MSFLELGKPEIQRDAGQLRIELQRVAICGRSVGKLLFPGEDYAKARESPGIVGITRGDRLPRPGSFGKLALLLQCNRVGGCLRVRQAAAQCGHGYRQP